MSGDMQKKHIDNNKTTEIVERFNGIVNDRDRQALIYTIIFFTKVFNTIGYPAPIMWLGDGTVFSVTSIAEMASKVGFLSLGLAKYVDIRVGEFDFGNERSMNVEAKKSAYVEYFGQVCLQLSEEGVLREITDDRSDLYFEIRSDVVDNCEQWIRYGANFADLPITVDGE